MIKITRRLYSSFEKSKDYYSSLGVSSCASAADIKAAYFDLALKYHPDRSTGEADKFKEISAAYDVIGDEKTR